MNCYKIDNDVWTWLIILSGDVSIWWDAVTLITKWKIDVIINTSMEWKWYLNLYMDSWKLMIDKKIDMLDINENGLVAKPWQQAVTSWAVIKWTYIVRWLIWWYDESIWYTKFPHKLYIKWMFASLNTVSVPKQWRIDYINDILWWNFTKNDVNLVDVFSWRCDDKWVWTDGNNCANPKDRWWQNSLIFTKENIHTNLIK